MIPRIYVEGVGKPKDVVMSLAAYGILGEVQDKLVVESYVPMEAPRSKLGRVFGLVRKLLPI